MPWSHITANIEDKIIYCVNVPGTIKGHELVDLICKLTEGKIKNITFPKDTEPKKRNTVPVILRKKEQKDMLLKIKKASLHGKLIFFSATKLSENRTWILSGFPKTLKECDVLSLCSQSGNKDIRRLYLDPNKFGSAYVQFNEDTEPRPSRDLIWKLAGTATCQECHVFLPSHSET